MVDRQKNQKTVENRAPETPWECYSPQEYLYSLENRSVLSAIMLNLNFAVMKIELNERSILLPVVEILSPLPLAFILNNPQKTKNKTGLNRQKSPFTPQ